MKSVVALIGANSDNNGCALTLYLPRLDYQFSPLVAMIPCKFVMIIWCWINIISHSGPI